MSEIKTIPAKGSRGARAKLYMIDDEWAIDPKVAQELAKKAYEAMGVNRPEYVEYDDQIFATSSPHTVLESDVFALINDMEDDLNTVKNPPFNQSFYDGYEAALDKMNDFFLGSQTYDIENGTIKHYLYGRLIGEEW